MSLSEKGLTGVWSSKKARRAQLLKCKNDIREIFGVQNWLTKALLMVFKGLNRGSLWLKFKPAKFLGLTNG